MPKRADHNQKEIVEALRRMGVFVFSLHTVGRGCPDTLCAFRGRWFPIEIKNGDRLDWKLNDKQKKFRRDANAPVVVLTSVTDAVTWAKNVPQGTPHNAVELFDSLDNGNRERT